MIELILPYPPSVNHLYGARGNRRFIKKAGVKFRQDVADVVSDKGCAKQEGRLAMFLWVHPPDKRRRDMDNVCKAILDGLQHAGCYDDDCQIHRLYVERGDVRSNGEVFVQIVAHRTRSQLPLNDYPDNRVNV